jgi:hypothetical protein
MCVIIAGHPVSGQPGIGGGYAAKVNFLTLYDHHEHNIYLMANFEREGYRLRDIIEKPELISNNKLRYYGTFAAVDNRSGADIRSRSDQYSDIQAA